MFTEQQKIFFPIRPWGSGGRIPPEKPMLPLQKFGELYNCKLRKNLNRKMNELEQLKLDEKDCEQFGREFLTKFLQNGFGTMPKKEIEILIFSLITKHSKILQRGSNYEVANQLKIPEVKVKVLKLESALKYNQPDHQEVIKKIINRLVEKINKPEFQGDEVQITLEDPVERREMEYAVKKTGNNIDYSINREILKIKLASLLEIMLLTTENGEKKFNQIIQEKFKEDKKLKEVWNQPSTWSERVQNLVRETTPDLLKKIIVKFATDGAISVLSHACHTVSSLN